MKGLTDNKTGRFIKNIKDRECSVCGKIFKPRLDRQKACSWGCRSGLLSLAFNKKHKHVCPRCGKETMISPSDKRIFCSHQCRKLDMIGKNTGPQNNLWQGGISFAPYTLDWTKTLKQSIRERDHYLCRICLSPQLNKAHHVHHIDYDKKNCNPDNLITLCNSCHAKTNTNRKYWLELFKNICQ